MRKCRLAVLASHPIQYFTPIYKRLARHPAIELEVMFYRDFGVRAQFDKQFGQAIVWDTDQLNGFAHRFLWNLSPINDTFNPLHAVNPGAFGRLLSGYDAVWLNGYMYPSNWLAALASRLTRTALLFRSELRLTPDRDASWSDSIRARVIRQWVRRSDALLYIGDENRRAYVHFGADPAKLFFSPYSADRDTITEARRQALTDLASARRRWGVPDDKIVVLFVGKLTPRKHPEVVLNIASDPAFRKRVHVVIAGSGPLEEELRQRTREEQLDNVTFLGFVNQSALPDVYAIADVFLLPSEREPWGIVLNEAMTAGAVPVVSSAVGAAADLVTPGRTGLLFPSLDWPAMRAAVGRLVDDGQLRSQLSAGAVERVGAYGHDNAARGVVQALAALGLVADTPLGSSKCSPSTAGT